MAQFSQRSLEKLVECDDRIQALFNEVIKHHDCIVLCGHRNEAEQNVAFKNGNSKLQWPNSKHNKKPSMAIDVAPYPIDWNDRKRFYYFAGIVMGIAKQMNINIRWGGDFNMDNNLSNDSFLDLPHFEII